MDTLLAAKKTLRRMNLAFFRLNMKRKRNLSLLPGCYGFFGGIGGHRYYLGHIGKGIAMTLTLGGFGIWALINAFFINKWVDRYNESIEREIIENIHALRTTAPPSTMAPPAP